MDFQQAEQLFRQYDVMYKNGQINLDQYRAAMVQLRVTDTAGSIWQIQEVTGSWFVFSNGQWIAGTPPRPVPPVQEGAAFREAERQYTLLDGQFSAGKITLDQYRTMLSQLRVTDANSEIWQLQERTRAWYVFRQGQWLAATPPGSLPTPPPQVNQVQAVPPPVQASRYAAAPTVKKPFPVKPVLFGAGGLLIVAALIVGGILLFKGKTSSDTGVEYKFTQGSVLTLKSGETSVQDDKGTTLSIDPSALPDENSTAQLTTYTAKGNLEKALSESYNIDTSFYEVTLQGNQDGNGTAELTLPASDPDSKLMMVVDNQYAVVLNVSPENGKLVTTAHLGPTEVTDTGTSDMASKPGSIYYAVVTPKQSTASLLKIHAENAEPDADSAPSCSPISLRALSIFNRCQSNDDGSVMVIYPSSSSMTHYDAYNAAKTIEKAVLDYKSHGFTYAKLSPSSPILAVVSSSYTSPEYNFKNGVIYLPPDIPVKLASEKSAIEHETAHWVQNRVYSMMIAKAVDARKWWMDVSAEMMVIDIDPDYISGNMATYGTITNGSDLVFQDSPYQWPADFYAHAQLAEVNMCDTGYCPFNRDEFVGYINGGRYPYNSTYAQQQLDGNMEDYARYLLGFSPQQANTGISLKAVQNQNGWGQFISITETTKTKLSYTTNADKPQVAVETQPTGDILEINAPLQKDSAYPLKVTSGVDGKYIGLPVTMTVDAGVPFVYRVDGGELQSSDGSQEVTIGPIHAGMGITELRIVAYSKTGDQTFSAQIEPVDMEGAWVIVPGNLISNTITCTGGDSETQTNVEGIARFGAGFFTMFNAMGDMSEASDALKYDWSLVSARSPAELADFKYTFSSTAAVEPKQVHLEGDLNMPKPESSSSYIPENPAAVGLALAFIVPAAGVSLYPFKNKKRKWFLLAVILLLMATLLSGCIGFALYGDIKGDVIITKMEYTAGEDTATYSFGGAATGTPIWTIKEGTGTFPVDIFIEASSDDANGNTTTSIEECTGTATFAITGGIYKDASVIFSTGDSSE
jgi:hypothetical protein